MRGQGQDRSGSADEGGAGMSDTAAQMTSSTGRVRERVLVCELVRFEPVSDAAVIAAIDRAERHQERGREGASMREIAEHLGFEHNSGTTRGLRPHIEALVEADVIVSDKSYGVDVWVLTALGRRRAKRLQRAGEVELPESPQHRFWRNARETSGECIDGFREEVRQALDEAVTLFDSERPSSDAWFALAKRLQSHCKRLASATYCLREWREPSDTGADIDDCREPGDDPEQRTHLESLRQHRRGFDKWQFW